MRKNRHFDTLLRLLLARNERRLLRFQRRESVIEEGDVNGSRSSDEDADARALLTTFRKRRDIDKVSKQTVRNHNLSLADRLRLGVIFPDWNIDIGVDDVDNNSIDKYHQDSQFLSTPNASRTRSRHT